MDVTSPLSGKITAVNIEPGKAVEEDEEIFIIEAMKMETPVYAPKDGVISKIAVKTGDEVEEDDLLAIID